VHLLSPPAGSNSREYGILRSFVDEQERDAFYRSDLFKSWQKHVAELTEGEHTYPRAARSGSLVSKRAATAALEDGIVDVARRVADELAGRDFDRTAPRWFSGGSKFRGYRRCHCRLPHVDRDAVAGEGFSFVASLSKLAADADENGGREPRRAKVICYLRRLR
jgi:hypothetical protein